MENVRRPLGTGARGDLRWGTLPALLHDVAVRHGDRPAVVDVAADGRPITIAFAELEQQARAVAKGWMALGVEPGDRVAVWAPNIWEWIVAALGLSCAGGVLVPVNTRFKGAEAAFVLRKSGARALLTVTDFLGTDHVQLLEQEGDRSAVTPDLAAIVVARGPVPASARSWDQLVEAGQDVSDGRLDERVAALGADDLCDISFTSGTTGQPKGVMATHGQVLRGYLDWSEVVGLSEHDRYLIVSPFFHAFGFKAGWLASLISGATAYPHLVFDGRQVLERIQADRITMLPGPPTLSQSILTEPDLSRFDVSSLRLAVTGAASIPVELILRMRDLSFERIITGYGLTEATGICTMCWFDDDPETIAHTAGRAIPGTQVAVLGADGERLLVGGPGEVVVKGYNVTAGYWDEPEETAATVVDGWLHTGDIGVLDERGYLRITDRAKDMYIVGGFNAYPAEIENAMLGHPAVGAVAVVGVPDDRLGEVGAAFVVLRPGTTAEGAELISWCRARMANYKVPRSVHIVAALPVNAAGKVLKYELRTRGPGP